MTELWLLALLCGVSLVAWFVAEVRDHRRWRLVLGIATMFLIGACQASVANLRVRLAHDSARLDLWQTRLALRTGRVAEVEAALDRFAQAGRFDEAKRRNDLYKDLKQIAETKK